jgi:GAF domain-containing protein
MGFGDELRAALRIGSVTWGVMCLQRELAGPGFTPAEEAFLGQIALHLAEGLRAALLIDDATAEPVPDGPGLVVLADDFSVASTTATAERWLAELGDWPCRSELPQAVRAEVARLKAFERATGSNRH